MKHYVILFTFLFSLLCSFVATAKDLPSILQQAGYYFLIDFDSKEVLLAKNADVKISPSSMTKMMTAYVVFDQIEKGKITLENQCLIGRDAWRKSGSSMFLNYGDVVTIDELLKGLLVVSGNDAAIALAGSVGGTYDNFIAMMNLTAREIGLKNSHFENPHGLNEKGHYMTLRDLATLTIRLYEDFPQYAHYFGITEYTYGNITQRNRNPLIKSHYEGILGGKTGHTDQGGYGVAGIVQRHYRKLVGVINKARTPMERTRTITALFDYGFKNYKKLELFEEGQEIAKVPTWLGMKEKVSVVTNKKIALNLPREQDLRNMKVKVRFIGPVRAPIAKGAKIADLVIEVDGYKDFEFSLFAKETVEKVGILEKIAIISRYKFNNFKIF